MDAVYSGQAGTLALLEGAEVRVVRAGNLEYDFVIGREGAAYLFQGCNDLEVLRGVQPELARARFVAAWEADRALRLILIAIDSGEESGLREEAADWLESLLRKEEAIVFVENRLCSNPLPDGADAAFFSTTSRWPIATALMASIVGRRASITEHRDAWDRLPIELFEDGKKADFEERAIRMGAFRILASVDPVSGESNLAILSCHKALSSLPNERAIVSEWTRNFRREGSKPIILPKGLQQTSTDPDDQSATPAVRRMEQLFEDAAAR